MSERGHQKLEVEAVTKGFDKAAKDHEEVGKAQEELTGGVKEGAEGAKEATEAQEKLNASESDYIQILTQLDPRLGMFADMLLKGSKIAGDLASQNINVAKTFAVATGAIKANAGALKLIGAGGAVVLGIMLIVRAVRKMREEFEQATKAISAQIEAMTELRGEQRAAQESLEAMADLRREGGYGTAEEARASGQREERVRERAPFLDEGAIKQAVVLADAKRSIAELAQTAFLIQTGRLEKVTPEMPPQAREARIDQALERHAEVLAKKFNTETEQQRELYQKALQEIRVQLGGSLDATRKVIEDLTRGEGVESGRLARGAQFMQEARAAYEEYAVTRGPHVTLADVLQEEMRKAGITLEGGKLTQQEMTILERVVNTIEAQGGRAQQPVIINQTTNHNEGSWKMYPDGHSQRRAQRGSEHLLERAER